MARAYRTHSCPLYRYGCRTEVTEVPGTGNTRENTRLRGGIRFEVEDFIQLAWHVLTGPTSPMQSVTVWALSTTTAGAIYREPQLLVTGATAALTATVHITAYPVGDVAKNIMAVARPIFPPTRSAKCHKNKAKGPKTQSIAKYFDDSCIAVVVPCVAFLGFLRQPKRG